MITSEVFGHRSSTFKECWSQVFFSQKKNVVLYDQVSVQHKLNQHVCIDVANDQSYFDELYGKAMESESGIDDLFCI